MDSCPQASHLCDVSVLINRVSDFASRKNGGCVQSVVPNHGAMGELWPSVKQSAINHSATFLVVSMVVSFVVGSLLTFCAMSCWRCMPRRVHRYESELVSNAENGRLSSEFEVEEPEVVID
jgi:hypothetical protein